MDSIDRVINICLEYTDDVYIGPDIINVESTLNDTGGMVFDSIALKRSRHENASVFLYQSIVAVKMKADYLSDLGNKLAKFKLAVKQCIANREGECVVKFIQINESDL